MTLALMLARDKDALICDLAETYGIFDHCAVPLPLLATLAAGLRDTSRIKMQLTKTKVPLDTMLLGAAVDRLSLLVWAKTTDAQKGRRRPAPILGFLQGEPVKSSDIIAFDTAAEFEAARAKILGLEAPNGN